MNSGCQREEGGREPPARAPVYSIAHSKRSLGHFDEAVRLIREQLNQFPGDIEGFMLLASIQAENLVDLQAAQSTIEHLLNTHPPPQAGAAALFALADWHMSVQDVDSTRATLERIHSNYPSTPMARIAAQRIADMG